MEEGVGHQPAALTATRQPQPHDNLDPHSSPRPQHLHHHHPHAHPNHPQSTRPGSQQQEKQQQRRRHRLPPGPGVVRSLPWAGLWLLLLLTLIAAQGGGVEAAYERTCTVATILRGPHRQGLCGDLIPQTLKLLCFLDGYNGYRGKREAGDVIGQGAAAAGAGGTASESGGATSIRDLLLNKQEAFTYLRSKRGAAGDGTPFGRKRRQEFQGITCECCYNRCTVQELRQYCRPSD